MGVNCPCRTEHDRLWIVGAGGKFIGGSWSGLLGYIVWRWQRIGSDEISTAIDGPAPRRCRLSRRTGASRDPFRSPARQLRCTGLRKARHSAPFSGEGRSVTVCHQQYWSGRMQPCPHIRRMGPVRSGPRREANPRQRTCQDRNDGKLFVSQHSRIRQAVRSCQSGCRGRLRFRTGGRATHIITR